MSIIRIEGDIGAAVTAESVRWQLQALPAGARPQVLINSDGGSVSEAVAIFQELLAWPGGVDTEVVGWALSAASVVLLAGSRRRVHATSLVMVHAPWVNTSGNAEQLRQRADVLDQVQLAMRAAYLRTGRTAAQVEAWFDGQDHWFTADQALALGLATEIAADADALAASLSREVYASCRFPVPQHLIERINSMNTQPQPQAGSQPSAEVIAAAVRAENKRQSDIRAAFARHPDGTAQLLERCLADTRIDAAQAKLDLLAHLGAQSFPAAGHYVPADALPGNALERGGMSEFLAAAGDALLLRGGVKLKEPHPAVQDVKNLSVVAMAERVLSMRGQSTRGRSPVEIITAALSTGDFPALLANVSGKALRTGYEMSPATFRGWTGEREVPDFKPQSLVMLSEAPGLLKVLEGAEYKFGKFDDSGSSFQVETFGRLVSITRQALINDELGAFVGMLSAMAQAAVRVEADSVYSKLTSNPVLADTLTLFNAGHGNVSAAAAPSVESLGAARAAMRRQKGLQGLDFIDPQPRYLIVPVALETKCEQLLSSLVDPAKSNDTTNVEWVRRLELVADPRLDAASESVWYLGAAPEQVEGIVRAYLVGAERPYLEQKDEFTRDVTAMKVRHDLAVGVVDFRALHRVG